MPNKKRSSVTSSRRVSLSSPVMSRQKMTHSDWPVLLLVPSRAPGPEFSSQNVKFPEQNNHKKTKENKTLRHACDAKSKILLPEKEFLYFHRIILSTDEDRLRFVFISAVDLQTFFTMVVPMDPSDATAVRHLLTATQRFAAKAEESRRQEEEQGRGQRRAGNHRYRYQFDDFDNFDENSDDERDYRDINMYTSIDSKTGKVTELWLGIIDVHGHSSRSDDKKHWTLSESDWQWLTKLDRLEHFKLTGCGALPHRQLKELRHLKHISCSECGNLSTDNAAEKNSDDEDIFDLSLPQVKSISLRCGFQPNPAGVKSLRAMFRYIHKNMTNLERITVWRLDQQLLRGQIASNTTALQREEYKRQLVETLLEELSGGPTCDDIVNQKVVTLELNRCGLNSTDFKKLMFEILPKRFPNLQRLSLSSNDIEELPEIEQTESKRNCKSFDSESNPTQEDEASFAKKKRLFHRLRKSLQQIHLSNNPVMEFLGKNGDENRKLSTDEDSNDGEQDLPEYQIIRRRQEEEDAIVLRRLRRIKEFEKLRDWLRLLPRLSQLGYVSCMHNLMRSTTEDFELTTGPSASSSDPVDGDDSSITVVPFLRYSKYLQRQIEYYLRLNRGGRWLIDGGGFEGKIAEGERDNLLQSLALWPNILEWSYRTSSSGCFLLPLPQSRQPTLSAPNQNYAARNYLGCAWVPPSSLKNATALYGLLREGPALCGK